MKSIIVRFKLKSSVLWIIEYISSFSLNGFVCKEIYITGVNITLHIADSEEYL